jgi:pyruvate/2-oxoglutarate dehydrogenase complex dihydrolipoamide dehydrogenase (E3) component
MLEKTLTGLRRYMVEYDAIWFGGGSGGRFGATFHKALGGKPLIIEACHLGGE